MKKRPERLSAQFVVNSVTAYDRTLVSEHCTHGLHVPLSGIPAIQTIPRVISWLG